MVKIPDIIQLNDWESKKFLRMMVAIHFAMLGAIGLDFLGIEIPILRQVIGFIYLSFVPGIVILRLLRVHRLGVAETILLSTGMSISFLMFSGFFLNSMLSFLNFKSPLSFWNVIIFITVIVAILSILSSRVDKFFQSDVQALKISRSTLVLLLMPVLSIVGTYLVNFHQNNILLLILIVIIALIPVLVAFEKISPELYPLTVVVIALSLLLHNSLISMYITGVDIFTEYYVHKMVVNNAYWNPETFGNVNAMLSIGILPAVYSYFLKIDGAWVFKVVYPIIFSVVPLGLYCVYKRQIKNDSIAFFSVFFFMSFFTFFNEMLSLNRQQIAEIFFVLLIFLMVQDTLNRNVRNIIILVFGVSLVVSHYGLSYIYLLLLIIIYLFSIGFNRTLKIRGFASPEFNLKKLTLKYFLGFYIIFLLLWYMNVSQSTVFKSILNIGGNLYTNIFTDFFNPETQDRNIQMALGIVNPVFDSFERLVHRDLQLITQFLIIIGFLKLIIDRQHFKFKAEYFYLIVGSLVFIFISFLPNLAKSFNMTRIYHISLFALSPLLFIGGIFLIERLLEIIKVKNKFKGNYLFLILILGVLVPYFLFNTGFVYEITNDSPTSLSLGMERMRNNNDTKYSFNSVYKPEQDIYNGRWYYKNANAKTMVYSDSGSKRVLVAYGMVPFTIYNPFITYKPNKYYIFLTKQNVCNDNILVTGPIYHTESEISHLTSKLLRVYSNGCGEIYKK